VAPGRGEEAIQLLHGLGGDPGELAAAGYESVCRQHAGAARVGQDRQAWPLRAWLFTQGLGHVEEVRDVVHAQDAAAHERGVEHLVGAGQGAGVRGGRVGGGGGAAGLDDDNRFSQGDLAGGRVERAGVAHGLHVDQDALGLPVVAEVVDQVPPPHVHHGADADEGREAHVLHEAAVEDGRHERPALAQEADVTGTRHSSGEGGVETRGRVHHPEAVGTDDPHASPPGLFEDLPLQLGAFGARLPEARRDDDRTPHPTLDALADDPRHRRRGRGDDRQVHELWYLGDARVGLYPEDVLAPGVHRIYRPPEGVTDKVPHDRTPDAPRPVARPDDGDGVRIEDSVERPALVAEDVVGRVRVLALFHPPLLVAGQPGLRSAS